VRARLGFTFDRNLLYATGGLMIADLRTGVEDPFYTLPFGGPMTGILFTDKTKAQAGWTVGGGVEHALAGSWSVRGEYLYFDLGTKRVTGAAANIDPPNLYGYDMRNTGSIARLGLNTKL
jgi:outer membrane immunogenic protein